MKKRIRDFSHLCGINTETIRYYEQMNLLYPHREESSGFRSFDEQDLILLAQVKQFQGIGCSLNECAEMDSAEQANALLAEKQTALEAELASVSDRLNRVKQMRRQFDDFQPDEPGKFIVMSGVYRIFVSIPSVLEHPNTPELVSQLIQLMPFAHSTFRIPRSALLSPQQEFTVDYGLGILENYAARYSFIPKEPMEHTPMTRCFVQKLKLPHPSKFSASDLEPLRRELSRQHLTAVGDLYGRILYAEPQDKFYDVAIHCDVL